MRRRLYLVLPSAGDAQRLASELAGTRVDVALLRTTAPRNGEGGVLRQENGRQAERLRAVEDSLWFLNLLLLFTALSGLLAALYLGHWGWALAAAGVAVTSVGLGGLLVLHLVRAGLVAARVGGGAALVIEGPGGRVGDVERLVVRRHPGAFAASLPLPWGLGGRGAFIAPALHASGRREPHAKDLSQGRRAHGLPPDHPGRGQRRPA